MGNTNTYVLQDLACTKIKTRKEKANAFEALPIL